MPNPANSHEPEAEPAESTESAEPAEPLNRAERRAQRRGKKPPPPVNGPARQPGHPDQVLIPRRSGRRGNR